METRKFKQVPSINRIGDRNPNIPAPVIVSSGKRKPDHERASDNEQSLLGMDVLSLRDFSFNHLKSKDGQEWVTFMYAYRL